MHRCCCSVRMCLIVRTSIVPIVINICRWPVHVFICRTAHIIVCGPFMINIVWHSTIRRPAVIWSVRRNVRIVAIWHSMIIISDNRPVNIHRVVGDMGCPRS